MNGNAPSSEFTEIPLIMSDTEVNCTTFINGTAVSENDKCDNSLLQKHCLMNNSMFKKFRSETLSKISNEYHDREDDDCMDHESESDKSELSAQSMKCKSVARKPETCSELSVKCLQSYDDLIKICENSGLKFADCSGDEHFHKLARQYKLKRCSVKCLQSYEDLIQTCATLNLKLKSILTYQELYEVDLILDDKIEEGVKYYLIKWKNYDLSTCTWEPYYHLTLESGCEKLVIYYDYLNRSSKSLNRSMLTHFIQDLVSRRPYDLLTLSKLCSIVYGVPDSHLEDLSTFKLKQQAKSITNIPLSVLNKFKHQLFQLMAFSEARKKVLLELEEWKDKINSNNPAIYIEVENNVDLERVPSDFQFIHDYVSEGITVSDEPVAFCKCDNCYENKSSCCPRDSDGRFAYNRYGRLLLLPGYPIYECNKLCKCGPDCMNRVVQHGQKIKVAIFRTSNGCGWGLKALETIHKDQFVLEYLGEILTSEDAEIRGNIYDDVGRSYLFDLDYGERNCQFTVDAGYLGNAAHFINHSCDPNLHVFAVWINNQDPRMPRLAFFAKRKISRGEELTFDYKMVKNSDRFDSQSPGKSSLPEESRVPCKCGSRKCRKYLF